MSSPPPPDQRPSQPPDAEEGFYGAGPRFPDPNGADPNGADLSDVDLNDVDPNEDTGPVQVVTPPDEGAGDGWPQGYYPPPVAEGASYPPVADDTYYPPPAEDPVVEGSDRGEWPQTYRPALPEEDTFAGRFTAPLSVDPRTVPVKTTPVRPGLVVAGVAAGVLALGLAIWQLWPSSGAPEPASSAPAPSTTEKPVDTEAQAKLLRLLPPGYPSTACEQVDPPNDALAQVNCTQNADTDGPPSATYTLVRNKAALQAAFDGVVRGTAVVVCPGNIQSPGPWRRNATPQQVSGTLMCGLKENRPTLAWTDDIVLLLGVVRAEQKVPNLDQLYAWWSTHS
jgi:serine/threonine kinase PknH